MIELMIKYRRYFMFIVHLLLFVVSSYLAFLLRFDGFIKNEELNIFIMTLPLLLVIRGIVFYLYGLQRGLWKYVSTFELRNIVMATGLSSLIFSFFIFVLSGFGYPRSVIIIDSIILIMMSGGVRLFVRMYYDYRRQDSGKRILIFGAGCAGEMLLREIRNNRALNYRVLGFMDDNLRKKGLNIQGIPILGTKRDLKRIAREKLIEEVIIATPSANGKQMRFIVERCKRAGVSFKTIPGMGDIVNGNISVSQIREVRIEDLLFRKEVKIDNSTHQIKLFNKTVMVTGAAGSIGSELVRQLGSLMPKILILFDQAESNLFFRNMELKAAFPDTEIISILGDILNNKKLEMVISKYKPHIIFHAAAYKHVPMIEKNSSEAVKVNVIGTKNIAALADKYGVDKFVFVSTDKAVNPSSIMGATKRVAELFIKDFAKSSITRFIIVRFGNVLGSDGSIIPIIRSLIEKKAPVTITHPEIKRFFMTIPEAVSLVIQAGYMGKGGEIFVLKMGEQIKILDLAKTMISLSGYQPFEDIKIVFTGLRPGEKLFEELYYAHESIEDTSHSQIQKATGIDNIDGLTLSHYIDQLTELAAEENSVGIYAKIKQIVTSFQSPDIEPAKIPEEVKVAP